MRPKKFCAACFRVVGSAFLKCITCKEHYHKECSGIDNDNEYYLLTSSKYAVYNCNKCFNSSQDLTSKVSELSNQIIELKNLFDAYLNNNNIKESAQSKNEKSNAKPILSFDKLQQRSRSPLRTSFSSNSNALHLSNGHRIDAKPVIADHDVHNANVVVPTELDANKLKCKVRVRRASLCLSDASFNNDDTANVVVPIETTNDVVNETKSNFRLRRPSLCLSQYSDDNAANKISKEINDIPVNNLEWVNVQARRKRKCIIFGDNNNKDLDVIADKKWVHLSYFKPSVTVENIVNYISKNAKIGLNHLECYKLVKKGADMNKLRKLSFKIGITAEYYNEILNPSLWPVDVKVRQFQFFNNKININ